VYHPFVYDDIELILRDTQIQSLANLPAIVGFREEGFEFLNRWTRGFSYALEFAAVGPYAPLFHLDNVLLHCLVGLLVYALIWRVSRSPGLAWWTAALFLVHPLGTEVVAHVSGRRELLATLFSMVMMLLLLRYLHAGGLWRVIAAGLSLYLAAYSKEFAVMAPIVFVVLVLYARSPRAEPGAHPSRAGLRALFEDVRDLLLDRKLFWIGLAFLSLALALSLLLLTTMTVESRFGGLLSYYEASQVPLSFLDRARLAGMGLRLLVAPVGQSPDYGYDALGLVGSSRGLLHYLDLGVLGVFLGLTAHGLMRRSWIGFGGAWFFLFYLPHTGIITWHEIFAERWLYAAGIGFHLAVASALLSAWRAPRWRPVVGAVAIGMLVALTGATILRSEAWSGPEALWTRAVERFPGSARAHKGIANVYLRSGRLEQALEHFRIGAEIIPGYRDLRLGVAASLKNLRRTDEAMAYIEGILDDWPEDPHGLYLKGQLLDDTGNYADAVVMHERAIASDPTFARAYNELGRLYAMAGDVPRAIEMLETCLRYDPTVLSALRNLATVYRMGLGDEERAAVYEERAREFDRARGPGG
jgi:tetratricopeptide (TPR) repeat protein